MKLIAFFILSSGLYTGTLGTRYEDGCPEFCSQEYDPVCGTDGITYGNVCELESAMCAKLSLKHPGNCKPSTSAVEAEEDLIDCSEPLLYCSSLGPVCGSDGLTYRSKCHLQYHAKCKSEPSLTFVHQGKCSDLCNLVDKNISNLCDDDTQGPVCDTNNVTHKSFCHFKVASCTALINSDASFAEVAFSGKCNDKPVCSLENHHCNNTDTKTVCDTDGTIYKNVCEFRAIQCHHPNLVMAECSEVVEETVDESSSLCPNICTLQYDPVCGSNGKTYSNKCFLEIQNCGQKINKVTIAFKGQCQTYEPEPQFHTEEIVLESDCDGTHECPKTYDPVCGSDGQVYVNECILHDQSCQENKDVWVVKHGIC